MKLLAWMLIFAISAFAFGQDASDEIAGASKDKLFRKAAAEYAQGRYQDTVLELDSIEQKINQEHVPNKAQLGLINYWRGISYNRLQDFPRAIENFSRALSLQYVPQDLHYEYGQALFAAEKLHEARIQFRESLKKKFKRGVSLYYIAYISKEVGDKKKAVTFYKSIDKLGPEEAKEVKQAAEMQIGDIYLEQVEKHPDSFRAVESYVIPQYQKALAADPESPLAPQIQNKILSLQRKYDLVLFQLRNGRPTLLPPYFLRLAAEVGNDSNVTFTPTEQETLEAKQASPFARTDVFGRYTFYHRDFLSVSPEFRFNATRYFNREPEIYRNDNYLLAPAIRTAYEHTLWNLPASVLFDYDYSEARRDVNAEKELEFASRSHALMIGERFNYFPWGETIFRLRYRIFDSYISTSDSTTTSLVLEQIRTFKVNTLLFFASFDRTRVKNSIYDTNALTLRADLIMGRVRNWFTPSFGIGVTRTDPVNNPARGDEFLFNPSGRLSKTFKKNWRANLKADYQRYKSDDPNFAYKKFIYSFEMEYLF